MKQTALLELAFRPFFLGASALSIVALTLWLAQMNSIVQSHAFYPVVWHAEQMIFGFAATVAVGFLLTAVQTWTGLPSISGAQLGALVLIWLMARLGLLFAPQSFTLPAIALLSIWWLWVTAAFARLLLLSQSKRNYALPPLLAVLGLLNISVLVLAVTGKPALALHLTKTAVLLFTLLMSIIGGRIVPLFTRSGLKREGIDLKMSDPLPWLEKMLPVINLLAVVCFLLEVYLPFSPALALIVTGSLHLLRWSRWRGLQTLKVPLLWSLHLSYLYMSLGLLAVGLSYWYQTIGFSQALHLVAVGGIGLMILAMISRVSLGHTGRPLVVSAWVNLAFVFLAIAALARSILPMSGWVVTGWNLSGLLWALAFGVFLIYYIPILSQQRADKAE